MANPATSSDKRFNQPNYTIVNFAVDFLNAIHAPVTSANVGAIVAWANLESGGYNPNVAGGLNNPLNIVTTPGDGHSGQGGSQGNIADFPDVTTAVVAYRNFWLPKTGIINAFRANAGIPAISAAVNSFYGQWGSSINFAGAPGVTPTGGSTGGGGAITNPQQLAQAAVGAGTQGSTVDPQQAQLTSFLGDLASGVPFLGPTLGKIANAASVPEQFFELVVGVLTNWRYILEVFLGMILFVVGGTIVLLDTKAVRTAGTAAAAGAALA